VTDNTDALPPLPASQAFSLTRSVYTADDMHAYARAALASRDAEIAKLRQGEPVAEIKWAADIVGSIMEVHLYDYELPVGTKLYASPPPAQPATPQGDEKWTEVDLWAEIYRLRAAVKGPEGYDSWQDAATAERIRRVKAEVAQPKREPLTRAEIWALPELRGWFPHDHYRLEAVCRAVERLILGEQG